jgi:hypothetical protein
MEAQDLPMNKKLNIKAALVAYLLLLLAIPQVWAEETPYKEYEIKAAFMYQFVNFIDGWRFQQESEDGKKEDTDSKSPIVIGVIGKSPFQNAFIPLKDKQVKGRNVKVIYFKGYSELNNSGEKVTLHPRIEAIKRCDVLFLCSSEWYHIDNILNQVRYKRILTIADMPGFLEKGGIINFVVENNMVCFEVNTTGAKRAKLEIRSKLLRLAKRIINKDNVNKD